MRTDDNYKQLYYDVQSKLHDDLHYPINILDFDTGNVNVVEHPLHHHHGPNDHDILIHDHDTAYINFDQHGHDIDPYAEYYGPANHDHDTDDTATDAA